MQIEIQATIVGYGGKPATLLSAYDTDTRVLVLGLETDYMQARRPGAIVLTNDAALPRDSWFNEEADLGRAIAAYYTLKMGVALDGKTSRLMFADRAQRANPEQSLERDGIDANGGAKYRVAEGVTCGQIATLITCLYVLKAETVERTVVMADKLKILTAGGIVSI